MSDWDIGKYKHSPDHAAHCTGFYEGYPSFELECLHSDTDEEFFTDTDGNEFDTCLVAEWWSAVGMSDMTGTSMAVSRRGNVLLWTTYPAFLDGQPHLTGWPEHQAWREAEGLD